jgi:VWFA-related protein
MCRLPVVVSCIAAALCVLDAQAPQQPTFRTGIDVVAVDVRVVDGKGRPVADLRAEEFVVTVDGKPRMVQTADFVSRAGTTATPPSALPPRPQPLYSTNLAPSRQTPGRTIVLVVDEDNIRPSGAPWATRAAARFLDRTQPDDLVGLMTISQADAGIDPTTDRAAVRQALARVTGHLSRLETTLVPPWHSLGLSEASAYRGDQGTWNRVLGRECGPGSSPGCPQEMAGYAQAIVADVQRRAIGTARAVSALLQGLAQLSGPKTVILISEELPVSAEPGERTIFLAETATIAAAAARTSTDFYVVHLDSPVADAETRSAPPSASADADMRSNGLEMVTTMTGGRRWMVSGQPDAVFDHIAVEISGYYLLGVRAEAGDRDGEPHEIRVAVRRPGVEVRARRAFVFPKPAGPSAAKTASDVVRMVLETRDTATTLPVAVTTYTLPAAAPAGSAGPRIAVLISAEIDRARTGSADITVGYSLVDAGGRNAGASLETLTLQPALGHPDGPLCYLGTALISSGDYTLRLAAADSALRAGSVVHRFSARPTNVGGYSLSDLVILDPYRTEEARPRPSATDLASGELAAYFEARAPTGAAGPLTARLELAQGADAAALASSEMTVQVSGERILVNGALPLAKVAAGTYLARAVVSADGAVLGRIARAVRVVDGAAGSSPPARGTARSDTIARPESATASSRAMQLVEGVDRDLQVVGKGQLTSEERKQRDRARALLQSARRMVQEAKSEKEMEARSLATSASKEVAALVKRQLQIDRLMAAAELYRSGTVGDAIQALSDSLASDLEAPVRYIEDNRDRLGLEGTALADVNDRTLAALCLLETDVAFLGRSDAMVRLAWTRRLLSVAKPERLPQRFVERWYIAIAGHLQGQFELMEAMLHVEDAVRRFPGDAEILAVAGMFYELVASPSVDLPTRAAAGRTESVQMTSGETSRVSGGAGGPQRAAASPLMAAPPASDARYERLEAAKQTGFGRAEELYRKAIAANAGHAEAHLRLGRVLSLTSRSDAALSELQVAAGSRDPRVHYLASMFQGGVQETATRLDVAVACYEEALRTCPSCLSAGLALSHAQRRSGDPDLAARTLDAATSRDATAAFDDYWWHYPLGALWQRDRLMRDLRGGLR